MPSFDRFDICEAYYVLEHDWHKGGALIERPRFARKPESVGTQLHRMGFRPGPLLQEWGYGALTDNGKEIYMEACHCLFGEVPSEYVSHEFEHASEFVRE